MGLGAFIFKSIENDRYKTEYEKWAFVQENWLNSICACSANKGQGAFKHWWNSKCLQQKLVRVRNVAEVFLPLRQSLQKQGSPGRQPPFQESSGSWQWCQIQLPIHCCFHTLYIPASSLHKAAIYTAPSSPSSTAFPFAGKTWPSPGDLW